ncbi:hypothetical protein JL193_14070 [Polaribacter batillariae]|uniref:Uncharacterized protein n=1 Tax=Polaribacter batillariae TaxID=2808900 RepID=A0ABX7SSK3_9FLAO|nr:hypothetical protein [Polaribacter batillariae]QTD37224.1 hypothetical protein JL193_14070 [Polaribacter batillariae]
MFYNTFNYNSNIKSKNIPSIVEAEIPISFVTSNILSNFLSFNIKKIASLNRIVIYNQLKQIIIGKNIVNHLKITRNIFSFSKGAYSLKAYNYKPLKLLKI